MTPKCECQAYLGLSMKMEIRIVFCAVWLFVLSTPPVFAHKVSVFGWVDGDQIHVEGRISGGKKPIGAKIQVFDSQGKLLHEGITNRQGAHQFKIPETTDLNIILKAGLGHQAEWTITKNELLATRGKSHSHSPATNRLHQPSKSVDTSGPEKIDSLTETDVERIVNHVLERQLKPIRAELAKQQTNGPDVRDILGGLGYILGLVGLAAYLRYRKIEK